MRLLWLLAVASVAQGQGGEFDDFDGVEETGKTQQQHVIEEDEMIVEEIEDEIEVVNDQGELLNDQAMDPDSDWDADEFEALSVDDDFETPSSSQKSKKKELKIETVPKNKMPSKQVYVVEYVLGACLAGYILNYVLGRVTNGTLAQRWFDAAESFLQTQFAMVGDGGEQSSESALEMAKEADHVYTLWCSGRNNMEGMLVTLRMVKRQDVFSQIHQNFVAPQTDRMIVRVTLDKIEPMCLVVGRSHAIREIAENYPDIAYFCGDKIRGGEKYNLNGHSVLTESADALSVLDKKCLGVLNGPVGDCLVSMHISDQFAGARVPDGEEMEPISKVLILVFDMTDVDLNATTCIKFSMYVADQLNKFALSREGLDKHRKKRQKREDEANRQRHLERQDELAARREEERRSQYQAMVDEEDPEKQKKLEIEMQRRDAKRSQRKTAKMKHMKIRA